MQRLLKVINESETVKDDPKSQIHETIERIQIVEDNNLSRRDIAKRLTINDDDVDYIFSILKQNMNAEDTLQRIDAEIAFNGIDDVVNENNGDVFNYLRNGDLYKDTIIYYNGKYFIGSIGALLESEYDISRLSRIK